MKKISFMLVAVICAVAANAQTMGIWNSNQVIYQQPISTIDSITFVENVEDNINFSNSNLATMGSICKTWNGNIEGGAIIKATFTKSNGVNLTLTMVGGGDYIEYNGSGKYILQGNLVLLCFTSGEGVHMMPLVMVYNEGKLYCVTGVGYMELH